MRLSLLSIFSSFLISPSFSSECDLEGDFELLLLLLSLDLDLDLERDLERDLSEYLAPSLLFESLPLSLSE